MKVFVKTLKGTHFEIEVKPEDSVADVKKNIETVQGSDVYPATQQMLIHQGKVLKDNTTLEENKVAENSFVVIMLTKNKVSSSGASTTSTATTDKAQPASSAPPTSTQPSATSQAPPPTVAPPQPTPETTPAAVPPSSQSDVYGQAASNLVAGSNLEATVQQILDMGGGSWDRDTVVRALRAAYNNPERAVEYLYSGIPEQAEIPPVARAPPSTGQAANPPASAQQPAAPPQPAAAQQPAAPTGGPNANPLDLFPQGLPNMGSNANAGTLDFLRNSQQFQAFRAMVQANPQILQPMLQELGKQNPHLMRLIQEHQADFLRLINDPALGLHHTISYIKDRHALKYVYVWHAITGYWGGVKPGVSEMEHYESKVSYPVSSLGVQSNEACECLDSITKNGLGLVNPEKVYHFYNELHSYLASAGIDGVKVDVQNILETLGAGYGGRVKLARKYHQALEASISRNFPDNGIISCMSHNTDGLYSAKRAAVIRASDDFWPRDPASHTIHIASVAYNTVFLGEFMQPDWDMFHSLHPMAEYHGAARAVGGCAIYVSDKPGHHDFNLLRKLVLPDGSILRAKLPGRPTKDCLFTDPARDGGSLLKIWNLNDFTGVMGVFNCQGAGWCRIGKKNLIHDQQPGTVTGFVRAKDVHYLHKAASQGWTGDAIIYSHLAGEVVYLPNNATLPVTLKSREYEVFTVVPVMAFSNGVSFAPVGLLKMFNSGGAIKELKYKSATSSVTIGMKVRGCGLFGAYSSARPKRVRVDSEEVEFGYEEETGLVSLRLRVPNEELYLWNIEIE